MKRLVYAPFIIGWILLIFPVGIVLGQQQNINLISEPLIKQNSILSIIQDKTGFLWFGTTDGLVRYDGVRTTEFRHDPSNEHSLSNDYVFSIAQDDQGDIWLGTNNGLNKFDINTNSFTRYYADPESSDNWLSGNVVRCLTWDDRGSLWIGTDNGVDKYDPSSRVVEHFQRHQDDSGLSHNLILSLWVDDSEDVWIGTDNGLNRLNMKSGEITRYLNDPQNTVTISNNVVMALFKDQYGELWAGTDGGLNRMDTDTGKITRYQPISTDPNSLSNSRVRAIYEDTEGLIWVGTASGLNLFNRTTEDFTQVRQIFGNAYSPSSEIIRAIYEDESGLMWIGTQYGGLYKHEYRFDIFRYYWASPGTIDGLSHNIVTCLARTPDNRIWIGTHDGLNIFDPESNKYIQLHYDPDNSNSISNSQIRCLAQGASVGQIWVGTASGLNLYEPSNGKVTRFFYEEEKLGGLSNSHITSLCIDVMGNLWVGTGMGLNKFDSKTGIFTAFFNEPSNITSIDNSRIRSICNGSDGDIWVSTDNGLNRIDIETGQITRVPITNYQGAKLPILTVISDNRELLWLVTDEGVKRFNQSTFNVTQIEFSDGSDKMNVIINIDNDGNPWAITNNGLYKLIGTKFVKQLGRSIIRVDSANNTATVTVGDLMYFGGLNGFMSFNPEALIKNDYSAPIVITQFDYGDSQILGPVTESIKLTNEQDSFTIYFALLDYLSPELNTYSYILEGYQKEWQQTEPGISTVSYSNLKSGKYIFRVNGSNCDGILSDNTAIVEIYIAPPLWQNWWFILLSLGILASIIWIFVFLRTRVIVAQKEHLGRLVDSRTEMLSKEIERHTATSLALERVVNEQQLTQERLKQEMTQRFHFVRILLHEIKTPLTSMRAATEILLSQAQSNQHNTVTKTVYDGVRNIERRTNDLVDLTKGEVGLLKLNRSWVDIEQMLLELREHCQYEMTAVGCNLEIIITQPIKPIWVDHDRIWQVLMNLVENSIKHNEQPVKIKVSVIGSNDSLIIQVQDDGGGIDPKNMDRLFKTYYDLSAQGRKSDSLGLGLPLARMIIEIHGGQISVLNNSSTGCTIEISLPYLGTSP
ncbi:MAG: sensor histidine kinase [Dehalogenimonas sp.]